MPLSTADYYKEHLLRGQQQCQLALKDRQRGSSSLKSHILPCLKYTVPVVSFWAASEPKKEIKFKYVWGKVTQDEVNYLGKG